MVRLSDVDFMIDPYAVRKLNKPERAHQAEEVLRRIPEMLDDPYEIRVSQPSRDGHRRLLFIGDYGKEAVMVLQVEFLDSHHAFITGFLPGKKGGKGFKSGQTLYRRGWLPEQ